MSKKFTKLDAQLQPLPDDTPLDQVVAVRVQKGDLDFICAPQLTKREYQSAAKKKVTKLKIANSTWRMSTIEEELAIMDWTRSMPSKDPNFFGTEDGGVWTDDAVPGLPGYFRVVYFDGGLVYSYRGDYFRFFARPVRVGGLPAGQ